MAEIQFYCTQNDVIATGVSLTKLIELTDDTDSGVVDQSVFDGCRQSAKEMIDPYAAAKHASRMPFSEVPGIIRTLAADLTKYHLHKRRDNVTEDIGELYERCERQLDKIASGKIKLFKNSGDTVRRDSILWKARSKDDRRFQLEMDGF